MSGAWTKGPSAGLTVIASSATFPDPTPDNGALDVITDAGITPVLEFVVSGVRDLDGMISRHAAVARSLACELGLSDAVQVALARERAGHQFARALRAPGTPCPGRPAG